jgi:hypothetical protein
MERQLSTFGKIIASLILIVGLFIVGSWYGGPGLAWLRDAAKPTQAANGQLPTPTPRPFPTPRPDNGASTSFSAAPQTVPAVGVAQAAHAAPAPAFTEPGAPIDAPAFDPQTSESGVNPATRGQMRVAPVEAQEEPPVEAAPVHPATGGRVGTEFGETAILGSTGTEFDGQQVTIVSSNESGTVTVQLPDGRQINVLKFQLSQP